MIIYREQEFTTYPERVVPLICQVAYWVPNPNSSNEAELPEVWTP